MRKYSDIFIFIKVKAYYTSLVILGEGKVKQYGILSTYIYLIPVSQKTGKLSRVHSVVLNLIFNNFTLWSKFFYLLNISSHICYVNSRYSEGLF